jgi:hypothetical protein
MINWKGNVKWSWPNLWYYPGICLEELRIIMKTIIINKVKEGKAIPVTEREGP